MEMKERKFTVTAIEIDGKPAIAFVFRRGNCTLVDLTKQDFLRGLLFPESMYVDNADGTRTYKFLTDD